MTLREPGWLILLLLLPVLATGAALTARTRSKQWSAFVSDRLRPKLLRRSSPLPRWIAFVCLMLACVLLIICLARPQTSRGSEMETILGRNILLVLDLSRSMKVQDVNPDRLTQAKATCFELLDALPNDRIGLVGFAGGAYLFAPLTVDHAAVRETISQIDIDWIPVGGSDLAAGIELAVETLEETGTTQNALILMSDGEEHDGRITRLAEEANNAGIEIISIGFGTPEGDFVPDPTYTDGRFRDRNGQEVISRLEAKSLEQLATLTGGRFAIANSGADIPTMVQAAVSDLERVEISGRERAIVVEYYQWFLLPAIFLLIIAVVASTRWRRAGALVGASLVFLIPQPLRADAFGDAKQALAERRFEDAQQAFGSLADERPDSETGFRYRLAEGNAAYRMQNWPAAREAYSEALRSSDPDVRDAAHHGLGNCLFEIGWIRLSGGTTYPDTNPEMSDEEQNPDDPFERLSDNLLDVPKNPGGHPDEELGEFKAMAKKRLAEWLAEETPDGEQSRGFERFSDLLTDWVDAAIHFEAATSLPQASQNRQLTVKHLEKLREIFNELQENAQKLQAVPQPGQGEPQEGQGNGEPQPDSEENGEGEEQEEGRNEEGEEEGEGHGDDPNEDGQSGESEDSPQQEDADGGEDGEEESTKAKPGETPEQAAKRILNENADTQKGALSPGRVLFRRPEKDW